MSEMYKIIVSGVTFTLSEASIRSDSPDTNLLAMSLLGEFAEASQQMLVLDRSSSTFEVIQDHLAGYTVFPLADHDLAGMERDKFMRYLLEDCEYYGLEVLKAAAKKAKVELAERKVQHPVSSEDHRQKIAVHDLDIEAIQQAMGRLKAVRTDVVKEMNTYTYEWMQKGDARYTELDWHYTDIEKKLSTLFKRLTHLMGNPPTS